MEEIVVSEQDWRVVIVGGPRCGKSTAARRFRKEGIPTLCGDPLSTVKEPETDVEYLPEGLGWSGGSQYVVDEWFTRPGPWCCEGQVMARALRKWAFTHENEEWPADRVIVVTTHHPDAAVTPGQHSMHKAVMTVWSQIATLVAPISTLVVPG